MILQFVIVPNLLESEVSLILQLVIVPDLLESEVPLILQFAIVPNLLESEVPLISTNRSQSFGECIDITVCYEPACKFLLG